MFQGFSDETFEFFMALSFNNNTEFFHANHDWYLRAVREPCLALAAALSDTMSDIDDAIELRPNRVVSRINRDLRYARERSPYRDYLWLRLRRPADPSRANLGFYFDISANESSFGMGAYEECRPHMNGLRRRLITEPETFLALWEPLRADFRLHMDAFKRMKLPENLHPELRVWYPVRSFWFVHEFRDFRLLKSAELVPALSEGFRRLAPIYRYIRDIPPAADADATKQDPPLK